MKIMRLRKWLIFCLLYVSCLGLISLILLARPRRFQVSPVESSPAERVKHINHARTLDKQISAMDLSKATARHVPLVEKSLLAFLTGGKPQRQVARRTLSTDVEDYEIEVAKRYTIFYYAPSLFTDSRQEQIDSLRQELYSKNTTPIRKRAIRKQLKGLLTGAEFIPFMHTVTLYPLDNPQPHD